MGLGLAAPSGATSPPPRWGLVGFSRSLATEFAPHNVRVNVVSPGSIDTSRANPEWYPGSRPPNAAGIPLGRQGQTAEIAAACLFLVSDDGGFITGQTLHVNGGSGVLLGVGVAGRQNESGKGTTGIDHDY